MINKITYLGFFQNILDIFFPKHCARCYQEGHYICFPNKTNIISDYYSPNRSKVDAILAISDYHEPAIKATIHELKYKGVRGVGEELGQQLYFKLGYLLQEQDFVVPVPLHNRRQRVRGFNQAQVIAQSFTTSQNQLQLVLTRKLFKHPQVSLSKKERSENVKDVFVAGQNITLVKGRNIFLIDDVATTGATLNACAKILKKAGAKKVTALVVARD